MNIANFFRIRGSKFQLVFLSTIIFLFLLINYTSQSRYLLVIISSILVILAAIAFT